MSEFTPGPWFVFGDLGHIVANDPRSGVVATCHSHSYDKGDEPETKIANANLIAAAPNLFDELTNAIDILESLDDILSSGAIGKVAVMKLALAKARGDTE